MSYIGVPPAQSFTALLKQDFTTSATTSYTLDHSVNNANDIALFINFVRQEPTAAYSASGTSLTLTSATSASDDMYCVYLGQALQTVNPPSGSVGLSQLSATGTKDSTTFLRGDNTFASAGGDNTPAFYAYLSADQSITHATVTKAQFNTELFDTDNCYDNSTNYRFTPTTAGKYALQAGALFESVDDAKQGVMYFYKNGNNVGLTRMTNAKTGNFIGLTNTIIVDANGTSDYFEVSVYHDHGSNINISGNTGDPRTYFSGYKLIT